MSSIRKHSLWVFSVMAVVLTACQTHTTTPAATPFRTVSPVTPSATATPLIEQSVSLQAQIAFAADSRSAVNEAVSYPPSDLYVLSVEGKLTETRRYTEGMFGKKQLSWSPDGYQIAMIAYETADPGQSNINLYIFDVRKNQLRMIMSDLTTGQSSLPWSSDGQNILIESRVSDVQRDLILVDAITSEKRQLTNRDHPVEWPEVAYATEPVVAPNGCCIAYIFSGQLKDATAPDGLRTGSWIRIMDWNGNLVSETATLCGKDGVLDCDDQKQEIEQLAWTAFGERLVFQIGCQDYYSVKRDGTDLRYLGQTSMCINAPVFSPDGNQIAGVQETTLDVIDISAENFGRIIWQKGDSPNIRPAWSPSGKCLAYLQWRKDTLGFHQDLDISDSEGETSQLLVSEVTVNSQPAWAPTSQCGE